jgi:RNA polymerase sigma factor (sigma-70 family)
VADDLQQRWALVLPHREHMLAVARRRCASEEDAEDCVQEAMLRVAQFEGLDPERVGALLTSVTARLAVDLHRARARARRHLPRLVAVPEQQAPPDEAALDAGEALWLAAQVQSLPEREREVLRQRAAGYSVGEAAARLSLSYKSVESAFTRARGRMRAWAGVGVLLVAEHLRRLRSRPAAVWTPMALVSAGCLILSSLPAHVPGTRHDPLPSSVVEPHSWWAGAPTAVHAAVPGGGSPPHIAQPSTVRRRVVAGPASSPGSPSHPILQAQVPVGPATVSDGLTGTDEQGSFVDFTVACLERQPYYQNGMVGCPPPQ